MSELTDDELMLIYSDGDAEAFDVLFDRHGSSVYNFACTMLRNSDRAEEMLQETFLAVARSAKTYEPRGQFRAWLMRIARNRCLNAIETQRLRQAVMKESSLGLVALPSREIPATEQLEVDETMTKVRQCIAQLPPQQREAIALYAFERMTYRQIGEILGKPLNSVKTLIHSARAALATAMDGWQKEKTDGM